MSFYTSVAVPTCGTVDAVIDDDFPGPSWTSSLEEIMARDVEKDGEKRKVSTDFVETTNPGSEGFGRLD
eukprot:scaffold433_cov260-Chaetoceros_neogracile.AAC.3